MTRDKLKWLLKLLKRLSVVVILLGILTIGYIMFTANFETRYRVRNNVSRELMEFAAEKIANDASIRKKIQQSPIPFVVLFKNPLAYSHLGLEKGKQISKEIWVIIEDDWLILYLGERSDALYYQKAVKTGSMDKLIEYDPTNGTKSKGEIFLLKKLDEDEKQNSIENRTP